MLRTRPRCSWVLGLLAAMVAASSAGNAVRAAAAVAIPVSPVSVVTPYRVDLTPPPAGRRPKTFEVVVTPVLTAVTPASGPRKGGQQVTITGRHLLPGARVFFGSGQATTAQVVSTTQITAITPAGRAGTVAVRVRYPDGVSSLPAAGLGYRFA